MTSTTNRSVIMLSLCLASAASLCAQNGGLAGQPDLKQTYRAPGPTVEYVIEPGNPRTMTVAELRKRFTAEQLALLEKLNRADVAHLWRMRQLVVPESFDQDELDYSPLPREWPSAAARPKALLVHLPGQVFGAYEYGRLVRWGPVSSGSDKSPTPEGFHHLNWKSRGRHSTEDPSWYMTWYFNFQNTEGRALHALEMPGYPASHSCIRMLERDARWLYDWGEQWKLDETGTKVLTPGTPVLLTGQYDFKAYYPWRLPEWLAKPVELPPLPSF